MASLPVPNTVQIDVLYLLFGQRCENVFHARFDGGVDATTLSDVENAFVTWLPGAWLTNISNQCSFIGLEVKNLSIADGSIRAYTPGAPVQGTVNSPAEPGNVSFCISGRSGIAGRSFRSRTYVIGMPQNVRSGNQVDAGWAAALTTALNALRDLLVSINGVLTVVSRIADNVERLTPLSTPIDVFTVADYNIDSQRRRLTGRGS